MEKVDRSENEITIPDEKEEEVKKAASNLQKKIHPDMNKDVNTERLSQLVNEARDKILKNDFN